MESTEPKTPFEFCDRASWISLLGGIALPFVAAFLAFSTMLPHSRAGARGALMIFVVAEVGAVICGFVGFTGIRRGRAFWIGVRSTIGVLAGCVGVFYTSMLAGFAGSSL